MLEPLISVIIPTYQDDEYLAGALESVQKQTYDNIEIVIVDSSSKQWLESLEETHENIVYDYQPPNGPAAARNRGIDLASGDLIAFLDADDRWHETKLEHQAEAIDNGADIVFSDQEVTRA